MRGRAAGDKAAALKMRSGKGRSLSLPSAASSLRREPLAKRISQSKSFSDEMDNASLLREGDHPKDGGRSSAAENTASSHEDAFFLK